MVDVGAPLIAYGETPEAIEPCESAFDNPSMPTELFLAVDALARNTREDAALAASFAATGVITPVVQPLRERPRLEANASDWQPKPAGRQPGPPVRSAPSPRVWVCPQDRAHTGC